MRRPAPGWLPPSLPVLGFGTHFLDGDLDGDLDLLVANGHVIDNVEQLNDGLTWRQPMHWYVNDGAGRFTLRSPEVLATPRVGRGLALLDHDRDGSPAVAVSFNDDDARIFETTPADASWVAIEVPGVGVEVAVTTGGLTRRRFIRRGESYQSSSQPTALFGLGEAEGFSVTIEAEGRTLRVERLPANRNYSFPRRSMRQ